MRCRVKKAHAWVLGILLFSAGAAAAASSKIDPRLRVQRDVASRRIRPASGAPLPEASYRVLMRVDPGTTLGQLRAQHPRVRFGSMAGPVVTATVPESALGSLDSDARVRRVEASRKLHPTLNVVRSSHTEGGGVFAGITINGPADLYKSSGTGVIVGVVDTGIDFRHLDFRKPDGTTRLLSLWDQTFNEATCGTCTIPSGFTYGRSWTAAQINGTIGGDQVVSQVDEDGHGTHVTGIAAGNGRQSDGSTPVGRFTGIAPEADIIAVKTTFGTADIVDAVNYIAGRANALGKRAVINLSLGGQLDPHDGTSAFDIAIAAVAASTPVVVAMGNDHLDTPHGQFTSLAFNQSVTFHMSVLANTTNDAEVDFWTPSSDAYTVSVSIPGYAGCSPMTKTAGTGTDAAGNPDTHNPFTCVTAGNKTHYIYIDNDNGYNWGNDGSTSSGNNEIYVDIYRGGLVPGAGVSITAFDITFTCTSSGGCGQVDGYVDPAGEATNFGDPAGQAYTRPITTTMGSPATANNVIAVGAYSSKIYWTDVFGNAGNSYGLGSTMGNIAPFSGRGPTRDGRAKPDVAAPGDVIASSLASGNPGDFSTNPAGYLILQGGTHGVLAGTSQATPVVTGIIAARLQGDPERTVTQLRAILQGLARSDGAVTGLGAQAVNAFGAGKVVATPRPFSAPTGLAAASLGISSISWSWSATTLSADAYNIHHASGPVMALAVQPAYVLTGLAANTSYSAMVAGEGGELAGPFSTVLSTRTYAQAPSAPSVLSLDDHSATISLNCPTPAVGNSCSGFYVEVATNLNFTGTVSTFTTMNPALTQTVIGGLSDATVYYVRVAALNALGGPAFSPVTSFTTTLSPPGAPTAPVFDQFSTNGIRFSWTPGANSTGVTFLAEAATANDFSGTLIAISGLPSNAVFTTLAPDTSYYFRVRAQGGPLLTVAAATATLALPPSAAAVPFSTVGTGSLTLNWLTTANQSDTLYEADLSAAANFSSFSSSATRSSSATFSGLSLDTLYYARVKAIARAGTPSAYVSLGSTATKVLAPSLAAAPITGIGTHAFTLNLDGGANPAGTRYNVVVSMDPAFSVLSASATAAAASASFTGLLSNQLYFAKAKGLNQLGNETTFSNSAAPETLVDSLSALASPVSTRTATTFGFGWSHVNFSTSTRFLAQLSSSPAFGATDTVLSSNTRNASAVFSSLWPNTTHYARVLALALNATPDGPLLSNAAQGATLPDAPLSAATTYPFVFATSMTVAFTPLPLDPSSTTAEGYRVELATSADFTTIRFSSALAPTESSAHLTGLTMATRYYARVAAISWEGLPNYFLAGSTRTILPPLSSGTVSGAGMVLTLPPNPPLSSVVINISGAAFPLGTVVNSFSGFFNTSLTTLSSARSNEGAITPLGPGAAFCVTAASECLESGGVQPNSPVKITVTYDPAAIPLSQDERRLQLMRYDPGAGQWTLIASQADTVRHILTAFTPHFSVMAPFFVAPGEDLSSAQIFPQPWEIGDATSGFFSNVLTFSNLPADADVKILTLAGELVWEGGTSAAGILTWNGNNRFGRRVASGTYYATLRSGRSTKILRVVVIR